MKRLPCALPGIELGPCFRHRAYDIPRSKQKARSPMLVDTRPLSWYT